MAAPIVAPAIAALDRPPRLTISGVPVAKVDKVGEVFVVLDVGITGISAV